MKLTALNQNTHLRFGQKIVTRPPSTNTQTRVPPRLARPQLLFRSPLVIPANAIIFPIGYPGSGKTTILEYLQAQPKLRDKLSIVSRDRIRTEMFKEGLLSARDDHSNEKEVTRRQHSLTLKYLAKNDSVLFFDMTNTDGKREEALNRIIKLAPNRPLVVLLFNTTPEASKARQIGREEREKSQGREDTASKAVPAGIIDRFSLDFQPFSYREIRRITQTRIYDLDTMQPGKIIFTLRRIKGTRSVWNNPLLTLK